MLLVPTHFSSTGELYSSSVACQLSLKVEEVNQEIYLIVTFWIVEFLAILCYLFNYLPTPSEDLCISQYQIMWKISFIGANHAC